MPESKLVSEIYKDLNIDDEKLKELAKSIATVSVTVFMLAQMGSSRPTNKEESDAFIKGVIDDTLVPLIVDQIKKELLGEPDV